MTPQTLDYVLSGQEKPWELKIIEYAVGYKKRINGNEVVFFWAALLMHPYDSLELLSDCLDACVAKNSRMPKEFDESFERIAKSIDSRRFQNSLSRYMGNRYAVLNDLSHENIHLPLPQESKSFLIDCASDGAVTVSTEQPKFLKNVAALRNEKYPSPEDYDNVVFSARIWRFLEAGRFLHGYAASLFMFPRMPWETECADFIGLADFFGGVNSFILTSPGVASASSRETLFDRPWKEVESFIDSRIFPVNSISERSWIKTLQYEISLDQHRGRVSDWISKIESSSPIKRRYVCGADWTWLENVLKVQKIHPFRGDLKAAYVFLLRNVEQNDPDYGVVKSILRPLLVNVNQDQFISMITESYKARSTAFLYYFLTPENLLLTGLAFSEIEAMAGRINALKVCIKEFGFCEVVTEEVFVEELRLLTSAISYKRLTQSEFEIPWEAFSSEQSIRTADRYDSITKLSHNVKDGIHLLGEALTENTIRFPNEVTEKYTLRNHQWAVAELAIEVIENFMQDPGYGLEAILGTRIRHNVLEREFTQVIDKISEATLPGILKSVSRDIVSHYRKGVKDVVSIWVDTYINTKRKDKPLGVFNIIPTQGELDDIIERLQDNRSHREMIAYVVGWIQSKIRDDLEGVRDLFSGELRTNLVGRLNEIQDALLIGNDYRKVDVRRLKTAILADTIRTIQSTVHWFSWPEDEQIEKLSIADVCSAVSGRFEREINQDSLSVHVTHHLSDIYIPRDKVRLVFDILSELFVNTLKYSEAEKSYIRIGKMTFDGLPALVVSNPCANMEAPSFDYVVEGIRFQSELEHLLEVGGSGLKRIAGAYSTVVGVNEKIHVCRRGSSFHVLLPLTSLEDLNPDD